MLTRGIKAFAKIIDHHFYTSVCAIYFAIFPKLATKGSSRSVSAKKHKLEERNMQNLISEQPVGLYGRTNNRWSFKRPPHNNNSARGSSSSNIFSICSTTTSRSPFEATSRYVSPHSPYAAADAFAQVHLSNPGAYRVRTCHVHVHRNDSRAVVDGLRSSRPSSPL